VQSSHDLEALEAQKQTYIGTFHDQLGTAIVAARTSYNQDVQNLAKARESRVVDEQIVAPMDAVVLTIGPASAGSVVDPSSGATAPLFQLTPLGGPLEAEIRITTLDEGFVRVGDPVRLKLDAYRYILHGTAEGVVKSVSAGTFTVNQNNQPVAPYYKVRVRVTKAHLHNVPKDFRLLPGMTLVGDIVVGSRTIITYLVEGALRTGSEAMREP
jgi:multidrug efflux pump subunit AcrA (membrane-fusion protein)